MSRAGGGLRSTVTSAVRRARRTFPLVRRRRPNPLFDVAWYLSRYPDVAASGIDAQDHYRRVGVGEGRNPNPLFDTAWYLEQNPDVARERVNPLDHYLKHGAREGRDPGPLFDSSWYLEEYPDIAASGMNPLLHYFVYGVCEGRGRSALAREPVPSPGIGQPSIVTRVAWRLTSQRRQPSPAERTVQVAEDIEAAIASSGTAVASLAVSGEGDVRLAVAARLNASALPAAGYPLGAFSNATSAIAGLEGVRASGVRKLAIHHRSPALALGRFMAHLERYEPLARDRQCLVYDLEPRGQRRSSDVTELIAELEARLRRPPAVLLWGTGAQAYPADTGFVPPLGSGDRLPYLAESVDFVVVDGVAARLDEARRVARYVLAVVDQGGQLMAVEWKAGLPSAARASVSIVVPTYNGLSLVRTCVDSVLATVADPIVCEIVVVDDASTDGTVEALEGSYGHEPGVRVIRNERNLGFVGSINAGTAAAAGDVLVLLNNDTIALPGWLPPLLETLERPGVGAAGGKLVFPDGRLQEAGGIVFSDGSGANFGYGDANPEAPEYSYLREVDYVSGALLAIRSDLFKSLGGLDEAYGFGYYDDSDLCFKLRRQGLRAYFDPRSVVVHREGGTSGTDLSQGPKQYQVRNRAIFVERWSDELREQPAPPDSWAASGPDRPIRRAVTAAH